MNAPWSRIVLTALALAAGVNAWRMTRRVPPPPRVASAAETDLVGRQERRLAKVRDALAARAVRGTVGYLSDAPPSDTADRYSAQFVLLPLLLDSDSRVHDWTVGNFAGAPALPDGLAIEVDFGGGVLLLRKTAP